MFKKLRERKLLFAVLVIIFVVFCLCPVSNAIVQGIGQGLGILPTSTPRPSETFTPEPSYTPLPSDTPLPTRTNTPGPSPTPTETPLPTATIPPTATKPPTATQSPETILRNLLQDALGSGNRDIPRIKEVSVGYLGDPGILFVNFAINDNLSESWIKRGARIDTMDIVEAIASEGFEYTEIWIEGTFSMVDVYGNTEEDEVIKVFYDRDTVELINWDNFISDNIYIVADDVWIHPAFQE
jgi:hypothetical protein